MNPIVKKSIGAGLAVATGLFIAKQVDAKGLLKDKAGAVIPLSGGVTNKGLLITAGVAAVGAGILYFAGKLLKINFLKS